MNGSENYAAAVRGELRAAQALASELMDGAQLFADERQQIADALRTALALADMRIVPADAIVLELPTEEAIADLNEEFPEGHLITVPTQDGFVAIAEVCDDCNESRSLHITPAAARMHAAFIALAAAKAEAPGTGAQ